MATILNFRALATKEFPPETTSRQQGSAEIVIFPGVRYERWDEPQEEPDPTSAKIKERKQHNRDTLKIEE